MLFIIKFALYFIIFLSNIYGLTGRQNNAPEEQKGIMHHSVLRTKASANKVVKVRIKDITKFAGVRDNQLVGYGLVVGLNGTGDTLSSNPYTKESLTSMLERLGVNIRDNSIPSGKNVAAVMVTANLPPFVKHGSRIDITVSALGDAKNLSGGTLLVTPLLGADGEVYAVGQGAVHVSNISVQARAASTFTGGGVPTSGRIINGAIIEKEIQFSLASLTKQRLTLRNPDLTTIKRIADTINEHFNQHIAEAIDNTNVEILLPSSETNLVHFLTEIEQLEVEPDQVAKIIIDPDGVIVMGRHVRISPIAVTHGSITVRVVETPQVSQPNPFTQVVNPQASQTPVPHSDHFTQQLNDLQKEQDKAMEDLQKKEKQHVYNLENDKQTQLIPSVRTLYAQQEEVLRKMHAKQTHQLQTQHQGNTSQNQPTQQATVIDYSNIKVHEEKGKFAILDYGVNLDELVNALNALGTSPREMAQILQSIKSAGALHADIIMN